MNFTPQEIALLIKFITAKSRFLPEKATDADIRKAATEFTQAYSKHMSGTRTEAVFFQTVIDLLSRSQ